MTSEAEVSGVIVNSVPKAGNRFAATYFQNYASGKWQATNFDEALAAKGATTRSNGSHLGRQPRGGGPIVRDKFWFYLSYRNWGGHASGLRLSQREPERVDVRAGPEPAAGQSVMAYSPTGV
jgi:hypothetical protein